jgi:hypothetical protein
MFSSIERKEYIDQTKEFINYIISKIPQHDVVLLRDKPSTQDLACSNLLFEDTTIFTKKDQETIMSQLNYPVIKKWDKKLVSKLKIVRSDTITTIFKDKNKGWNYFYKHYGRRFYTFSEPIFFNDFNFCLFESGYSCGGLCGSGQISLYKKEEGQWKFLKSFCEWVS